MSSSKAALKAIKSAIDTGDFDAATTKAEQLTTEDKQNYTAFLFLGFAHEKLNHDEAAEKAYSRAIAIKDSDPQAYKGLITVFEKQGSKKLDAYHDVALHLGRIFAEKDDRAQCQNVIDKYELFVKKHGTRSNYIKALSLLLPSSPLYPCLEGRVMAPNDSYSRILEETESEEREWINKEIGERRTRLGAKIDNVTSEVKREASSRYQLESLYGEAINWATDDDLRRTLEEKRFQRAYDLLKALPTAAKPEKRDQVLSLANGMVIVKHPYLIAWKTALEWVDAESLAEWDVNIFEEYIEFFPGDGLSNVLRGFLQSDMSPFPKDLEPKSSEDETDTNQQTKEADWLLLMIQGLNDCQDSLLAHRILAEYYLSLEEYDSAVDAGRRAQAICQQLQSSFAVNLQNTLDAVNVTLATALISHQSPRHHPEARALLESILSRKPTSTSALLGVGLILEDDEDYEEATVFLVKALQKDPTNVRIKSELAWCRAQAHDLALGLEELQETLDLVQRMRPVNLAMKSEILYRIGWCIWEQDGSKVARKDKAGAYRYFVDSIKANPEYSPPYTRLGVYFEQYSKNKLRARSAFHKAFELSTSEVEAAERLAHGFADSGEWDLVELVAERMIESGKARSAPGSKRKAHSWPYAAMGTVQLNKQQYTKAIVSFQAALRIAPEDYHSWVGLGESYHNSGRYIAATKTFQRAEMLVKKPPPEEAWFAKYMLAGVCRERELFEDAIDGYEVVLKLRPKEFGISIALLQTLAECAWSYLNTGLFGQARTKALRAMDVALTIRSDALHAFNFWKSIGDACSIFLLTQSYANEVKFNDLLVLLDQERTQADFDVYNSIDKVGFMELECSVNDPACSLAASDICILASILAYKRAVAVTMNDRHAQAVAWYNLGWAEFQGHVAASPKLVGEHSKQSTRFLKVAIRCFKRAIELEAGNSEFWNALGVVTTAMNAKVSQHAFIRSLHLNQRSALVWTNLGALYLIHDDKELANEAFTLAQSIDPDYSHAWLGQGLLALLYQQNGEAEGLFAHAFDIGSSVSILSKQRYSLSVFDMLSGSTENFLNPSIGLTDILLPFFALQKLDVQAPHPATSTIPYKHLFAQFGERLGSFSEAITTLEALASHLETSFENDESSTTLVQYACSTSDLARCQLASHSFASAIESASTALDLSSDLRERSTASPHLTSAIAKIRLSCHLTLGLSHFFLLSELPDHINLSIDAISTALSEASPVESHDIVCALAQVLWAKGGEDEKSVARERLFDAVGQNPNHVGAVCLLGTIAILDDDEDALEAVKGDLENFRISNDISEQDRNKVIKLLTAINDLSAAGGGPEPSITPALIHITNATSSIMLNPSHPTGWSALSQAALASSKDSLYCTREAKYSAQMAKLVALRSVLSSSTGTNEETKADQLSDVLAGTGSRKDALLSIMVNPGGWKGWDALGDAIKT
ncbi:putative antiviral protein [Phaeomoniella chlamydospora]|uniref:Putative antiviral protein n=1 Tax=Phaeomoniella chlamydospora TaxID=158046 RepID=A0A0G2GVS4_PHACM|nr:putative antiviral protein [Phaeomoniella chlamydospora]